MPSAELTRTQAPQEPPVGPNTPDPRSTHTVVSGHGAAFGPFVHPEAADREATAQPTAERSRCTAAFRAIMLWLLRVLTDSAGAWALAAGAPPDPSNGVTTPGGIVAANNPTYTDAEGHDRPGRSGRGR